MEQLDVRIVKLEPMRLVSVLGFGSSPEEIAWAKLQAFAKPRGLWGNLEKQRIFGFNNPNPSPGSPNYGYELWIEVGPGVEPPADGRIVNFDGGLYAVARCEVPQGGAYEDLARKQRIPARQPPMAGAERAVRNARDRVRPGLNDAHYHVVFSRRRAVPRSA